MQPDLFAEQRAARDEALDRVAEHADPEWKRLAWASLYRWVDAGDTFTADDVRVTTERRGGGFTHEPRAYGAIIAAAARRGLIVPTGRWVKVGRVENHGRELKEWRAA